MVVVRLRLCRLVTLFCRENDGWPTGIFPRAFSDMPLSCVGTASSIGDDIDSAIEPSIEEATSVLDCKGLETSSSSSDSSSSPIANALCSSEFGLVVPRPAASACCFRNWFCLSISSCPPSSVNSLSAWKRRFERTIAYIRFGFSVSLLVRAAVRGRKTYY